MKQFNRAFFRDLWGIVKPYWWSSEERWLARVLILAIVLLNLLMVYISYRITEWYNTFWNALQKYDAPNAWHQLLIFFILVVPYIVAAVYQTYLMQMLQIRWRQWLTKRYVDAWLSRGTYYQMQVLGDGTDNPDQRISQDLATFSSQTLNFVIGVISSVTTLAAFLAMLWALSAQVAIPWHGAKIVIPGYLVWAAVVYSACGTILTAVVGRRLIHLNFNQERFNADFRFSLVRLRENSESIAMYRGEAQEREHLLARFGNIFRNFWQIMRRTKRLNWWVSGYGQAAVIFPVLVSMPAYFAKVIQIGTIMQISSAFGQVQSALSFIVNSYTDLAAWHAVVDRLRFFQQSMDKINAIRETHANIVRRDGPRAQRSRPERPAARRPRAGSRPEPRSCTRRKAPGHGGFRERKEHPHAHAGGNLAVRRPGRSSSPSRKASCSCRRSRISPWARCATRSCILSAARPRPRPSSPQRLSAPVCRSFSPCVTKAACGRTCSPWGSSSAWRSAASSSSAPPGCSWMRPPRPSMSQPRGSCTSCSSRSCRRRQS